MEFGGCGCCFQFFGFEPFLLQFATPSKKTSFEPSSDPAPSSRLGAMAFLNSFGSNAQDLGARVCLPIFGLEGYQAFAVTKHVIRSGTFLVHRSRGVPCDLAANIKLRI